MTLGASLLILGLLEGDVLWPWVSLPSATVLVAGALLLVGFGWVERRAAEPILPGWVFTNRLLVSTSLASLGVGGILIGLTSYIPLYAQNVLGSNALVAGFALAALTLGWPLAASLAGRVYLRIGFRATALIGSAVVVLGTAGLGLLNRDSSVWQVGVTCFVIGLGMGWVASPCLIAAQSAVRWEVRGVVTGTNMFARSMGSALGIAVFGAIANAGLGAGLGGHSSSTAAGVSVAVLDPALRHVFTGAALAAVVMAAAVALMPRADRPSPT